jgi:CRP/FNR family cyclic AMP-dependent transcriptional regulator
MLPDNTNELVRLLAARGRERAYRRGTILLEEGDIGDAIYIILSGEVRVYAGSASGRELTFGHYGPGEYLGEMGLDGGRRCASVVTTRATTCAVVTRDVLDGFIEEYPRFAFELLAKVIWRARSATLSASQLALNDVYGRLKRLLEDASRPGDEPPYRVVDRLTHLDMASRIGSSREMVSKLMKDLERGGYVVRRSRQILIKWPLPPRW